MHAPAGPPGPFLRPSKSGHCFGGHELVWDGLNDERKPVPPGAYRIVVETNQEHGTYAKQSGTIELGDHPTSVTLPATANFEPVVIQYRPQQGGS